MVQAFDTLKATKALRDAGFKQAQAEALVVTVNEAVIANVVTKSDLKEMEAKIAEQFGDLFKHLRVMGLVIVTLTVALIKFL